MKKVRINDNIRTCTRYNCNGCKYAESCKETDQQGLHIQKYE